MRIAILGKRDVYEAQKIKEEGEQRGHEVTIVESKDILIEIQSAGTKLICEYANLYEQDIFLIRTPDMKAKYLAEILLPQGKFFYEIDEQFPSRMSAEKMTQYIRLSQAGLSVPRTVYLGKHRTSGVKTMASMNSEISFPCVVKGIPSSKGRHVFLCNSLSELEEVVIANPEKEFMVQEPIGNREDIRILVLHGEVLGGMTRKAQNGAFLTNVAQGGTTERLEVSEVLADIALRAARAVNVDFAGVDIMFHNDIPYILEVNNVPQFHGFMETTDVNVAAKVVDFLVAEYHQRAA